MKDLLNGKRKKVRVVFDLHL